MAPPNSPNGETTERAHTNRGVFRLSSETLLFEGSVFLSLVDTGHKVTRAICPFAKCQDARSRKHEEQEEPEDDLEERCQKGYKTHPKRKTKKMYGKTYRNCVKAEE